MQKPEIKKMYQVLRGVLMNWTSKAVWISIVFGLIQNLFQGISVAPVLLSGKEISNISLAGSFCLFLISVFCINIILFGVIKIFTGFALKRNFSNSEIYCGFKNKKVIPFALILTLIFVIVFAVIFFVTVLFKDFISAEIENLMVQDDFTKALGSSRIMFIIEGLGLLFTILLCALYVPFIFTYSAILDGEEKFTSVLKKNFLVIRGKFFHFIGFFIYSSYKNILAMCCAFMIGSLFPIISILTGIFCFLQIYMIYAKAFTCVPVYYYSFLSVNGLIKEKKSDEIVVQEAEEIEIVSEKVNEENPKSDESGDEVENESTSE